MSEEDPVVAIVRDGQTSCPDCIRDSSEHSIWTNDIDAEDLIRDLNIKLITASKAKPNDKCGRCGLKIMR